MYQINTNFSISRLNNAEITAFYLNLQKAIANATAEKLGLTSVTAAYDAKLRELVDRVYVSSGSEFTASMEAADNRRCLIFRRIRLRLQMVEVAEQNTAILACQDVVRTHLLSKYVASVTSRAYQERSSILQGFILDLRNKLTEEAITALGLADDITALETVNNEFIAAYNQRVAEKAEGNTGVTARMRSEMYDLYLQLIFIVQYLANSTDEANAEKAATCQTFIAHVNVLLSDAKKRLEQRLGTITTGTGTTTGDGSTTSGNGSTAGSGSTSGSTQQGTGGTQQPGVGEGGEEPGDEGTGGTSGSGTTEGGSTSTEGGSGSGSTSEGGNTGGTSGNTGGTSGSGGEQGSGGNEEVVF